MNKINMLVIGIDGACWPLIIKMIDAGELPNIKNLRENGVWGDMKSCIPPITYPAWKCYSTGKNPGKLGVFWWEYLDIEKQRSIIPNSQSFNSKEVWDYLNEYNIKTGIIGMPTPTRQPESRRASFDRQLLATLRSAGYQSCCGRSAVLYLPSPWQFPGAPLDE